MIVAALAVLSPLASVPSMSESRVEADASSPGHFGRRCARGPFEVGAVVAGGAGRVIRALTPGSRWTSSS
jgi:hypothetical protein